VREPVHDAYLAARQERLRGHEEHGQRQEHERGVHGPLAGRRRVPELAEPVVVVVPGRSSFGSSVSVANAFATSLSDSS
jgi:hypothetical protein